MTPPTLTPWPKPLLSTDPGYALLKPEVDRATLAAAMSRLRMAVESLNDIASWKEGEEVVGAYFDEPCAAQEARDVLVAIGPLPELPREG